MAFRVSCTNIDILFLSYSLDVKAGYGIALNTLVGQNFYFLLWMVKNSYGAIWASNCNDVFQSSNWVRHTLSNLNITVKSICNLFELFCVHQPPLWSFIFIGITSLRYKLTWLSNHFLSYLFERTFVFVYNFEKILLLTVFLAYISKIVGRNNCFLAIWLKWPIHDVLFTANASIITAGLCIFL